MITILLKNFLLLSLILKILFFHSDFQENSLERLNIESLNFDKLKIAYQVYTDFLNNHRIYDFDDMVPLAISTISSLPSTKKYLICPYDYLLVDEFQDTSLIQLKLLISILNTDNFYAVGDDDQSIYSFRGADPSIITTIKRIFPTLTTYILSENYRSISPIVDLSNKLIRHNSNRYLKEGRATIKTYNKTYIPLVYKEYESHYEEAEEIVKYIKNISKDKNIAILIRTYESGEVIRGLLIRNNINFVSSTKSNESIFKFKPIDISMAFISFAFKRNRNIKDKSNRYELIKILTTIKSTIPNFAINKDDVLMEDIKAYVGDSMSLKEDYKKLDCILSTIDNLLPEIAFEFIRRACGLDDYFRNEYNKKNIPYENYLDKMEEFKEITKGFSSNEALISFRNRYEDEIEINKKVKDNVKANVIFSTIHYVKGMEFNEVWIPNLNANILPSSKAKIPEEIEEERRLLYVAITRAKEKLILSSHKKEGNKISLPSPFLRELDFSNLRIL